MNGKPPSIVLEAGLRALTQNRLEDADQLLHKAWSAANTEPPDESMSTIHMAMALREMTREDYMVASYYFACAGMVDERWEPFLMAARVARMVPLDSGYDYGKQTVSWYNEAISTLQNEGRIRKLRDLFRKSEMSAEERSSKLAEIRKERDWFLTETSPRS